MLVVKKSLRVAFDVLKAWGLYLNSWFFFSYFGILSSRLHFKCYVDFFWQYLPWAHWMEWPRVSPPLAKKDCNLSEKMEISRIPLFVVREKRNAQSPECFFALKKEESSSFLPQLKANFLFFPLACGDVSNSHLLTFNSFPPPFPLISRTLKIWGKIRQQYEGNKTIIRDNLPFRKYPWKIIYFLMLGECLFLLERGREKGEEVEIFLGRSEEKGTIPWFPSSHANLPFWIGFFIPPLP